MTEHRPQPSKVKQNLLSHTLASKSKINLSLNSHANLLVWKVLVLFCEKEKKTPT